MGKLWSKGEEPDALVEEFTVGEDYRLDRRLIVSDIAGSLAHARMLLETGLLDTDAHGALQSGLLVILEEHLEGRFAVERSDEDGHTAIENRLVTLAGEAGKRIHLGRSRNDQILTVMRIWMRHTLFDYVDSTAVLVTDLLDFAERYRSTPMPGRTHMQPAMPSSAGLWAGGFAELVLDDLRCAAALHDYFDQCPLGSGAGYGTPLPLNRERTAELLGFSRLQVNAAYCGLSRGKFESRLLEILDQSALSLSRFAQDVILFSMPEFGWFVLPPELCTGSSIMPQKRNPDALELMRSRAASVGARCAEVKAMIRSLPSGYNRDYQDTKGPLISAADTLVSMMGIADLTIRRLEVNAERMRAAFDPGIFATDAAIALTAQGLSFRDAYREVGMHPERWSAGDPDAAIVSRTSAGTAGNLRLDLARDTLSRVVLENARRRRHVESALESLAGRPMPIR